MALSKVMATTSTANTDLQCQPSICSSLSSVLVDPPPGLGSMNMDDLLKNIYATPTPSQVGLSGASITRDVNDGGNDNDSNNKNVNSNYDDDGDDDDNSKSVDEVWKHIVAGGSDQRFGGAGDEEITLEDFLTKAGAARDEDAGAYGNNNNNNNNTNNNTTNNVNNNNQMEVVVVGPAAGGGRGKRRVVEETPLDKATQQKQRRMIKNRESAARSRERKQAYTVELESLVTQMEEEKARMIREEAEENKLRFKQLMENLIPVVEKRRPPRVLRRVHSLHW